jgi:hypothetical protein
MKTNTNNSSNEAENGNKSKPLLATGFCYVVECSAGQYDDYHWWIAGIFDNAFDAENLKREIDKNIEIVRNIPEPFALDMDNLTEKEYIAYDKWSGDHYEAWEFNSAKVVEYPFGKSCR